MKWIIKKYLVVALLLLSVTSLNAQQQQQIPWPTLADSPWPMMSHDPQATGRSPYVGPKTPNVVWTMDMPYGILSGPAIGPDNYLYFGTRSWLPNDTTNYFYSAYPDGTLRWVFYTGNSLSPNSGPMIGSDSTVYFGSQDEHLYAVKLNGELKWKYDTEDNISQKIINTDLVGNIYILNVSKYLYSFNRDGNLNWKVIYESGFGSSSPSFSPDGQTIYIGGLDSTLFALDLDGTMKWKYSCGKIYSAPLVDNAGNIYILPNRLPRGLQCISPDGELIWSYPSDAFGSVVMAKNGDIYFIHYQTTEFIAKLTRLDYDGKHIWTYTFEIQREEFSSSLIVDFDRTVYLGSTFGYYYYAISKDGELLWKLPLNGYQVDNTGAIGSDGTLYIGTHLSSTSTGQEKTLITIRDTGTVSVSDNNVEITDYSLSQSYPNPFNPSTTISYSIPESGEVTITVYDVLGRKVRTLVNDFKPNGSYEIKFNAKNLSSGVYIYRITTTNNGRILFIDSKQMLLMK